MPALDRILEAAAEARAAGVRAPADRPSQRRCSEVIGSAPIVRVAAERVEVREASDSGAFHFSGYGSVYNRGYEMWDFYGPYTEDVIGGAGAASLARADLDVPLVLAHDSLRRIARTTNGSLTLLEDETGLAVDAPVLDARDSDVAYIVPKLQSGLVDEMSFRFSITQGSWSPDWTEYHIEAYDIHRGDVAIVGYGANPHTAGSGLRSQDVGLVLADLTDARLRELESEIHTLRKQRGAVLPTMTFAALDGIERRTLISPLD